MCSTVLGNTKLCSCWPNESTLLLTTLTPAHHGWHLVFVTLLWSKWVSFCSLQPIWTTSSSQLIGRPWSSAESRRPCAVCPQLFFLVPFTLVLLFLAWLPLAICIPPWPESLVALMATLQILGHIGCENMIFPLTLSPSLVFKVTPQQSGS